MKIFSLITALALTGAAGAAAAAGEDVDKRYRTATVFGDDACPQASSAGEIVVCGRLPESERFRIPKRFRDKPRTESGPSASWGSRVETLEEAQRFTMPGSCTAVGSFGQSGCTQVMIRQWLLERRAAQRERESQGY